MVIDAARELLAAYRDENREPPIGTGHVEPLTIDTAAPSAATRAPPTPARLPADP